MGANTSIEWADSSWNPWIGCTKVSDGCKFCYAETMDRRALWDDKTHWGPSAPRRRTSDSNWKQPVRWNKDGWLECRECGWRGSHQEAIVAPGFLCPECEGEVKPTRRRVFCASLADVFERNDQLLEWRRDLVDLIIDTPNLDWLLLTKRPENVLDMVPWMWHKKEWSGYTGWPDNVWVGTSVENQKTADERIPILLEIPAKILFLSLEPLLEPIDLEDLALETAGPDWAGYNPLVDWVIVGGESGPNARPMHPDWARGIRDQCREAGIPFFFKQWGEWWPYEKEQTIVETLYHQQVINSAGWPQMVKLGKKAAGDLLDGREWKQFPESAVVR